MNNFKTYAPTAEGFMVECASGMFIRKDDPALIAMEAEHKGSLSRIHGLVDGYRNKVEELKNVISVQTKALEVAEAEIRRLGAVVEEKDEALCRERHEAQNEAEEKGCMFDYIQDLEEDRHGPGVRVEKYLVSEHGLMVMSEECAKLRAENYELKLKLFAMGGVL